MGEEEITPNNIKENQSENMNGNINGQEENPPPEEMDTNGENDVNEDDLDEDNDDMSPEEFAALDHQLDALNSALDDIEQKNDNIHSQLLELLHANREIRTQLQQDKASTDNREDVNKTNEPKA
ncbi:bublin coiled-coil protein [Diabrotica virgifera virgifera]|uniref:UPF0184 protein C9orf16 homolog n=1 Tax=Diabrotica virgifera virgifera TaxID=50390 RepID=A0A6P7F6X2_DIAVI|nr:bublin coiled-coil protein [Diabrotica virgifera virgifera]